MAGTGAFQVEGVVVAALANRTFRVALPNGHRLLGFVPGRARAMRTALAPGDTVKLELTPYDLSVGRIIVEKKAI